MKWRKKAAALLAFCVALGGATSPAQVQEAKAAEAVQSAESGFTYVRQGEGEIKITKYNGSAEALEIPPEIDGMAVSGISGEAFLGCSLLKSIAIPDSVREIGTYDDDTEEYTMFSGCANLEEVTVGAGNAWFSSLDGVLYDKDKAALLYCPEGKKGSVTVPASVTEIKSVTQNGRDVWEIFRSFKSLRNFILGSSPDLSEIIVEEENTKYSSADGVLYNKSGTELLCCPAGKQGNIVIPDGVEDIGGDTKRGRSPFYNCSGVTSIAIPASVESIGAISFLGCDRLLGINVDQNNKKYSSLNGVLYQKTFADMTGELEKVTLICCPAGKKGSFAIPDGVADEIGCGAFYGCKELESITIPASVAEMGKKYIDEEIYCEASVFIECSGLKEIKVSQENDSYSSSDGLLYRNSPNSSESRKTLVCCLAGKEGGVIVPEGVTDIGDMAFRDCAGMTSVTLPQSVDYFEGDYDNNYIWAFKNCSSLEEIIIAEGCQEYSSLDGLLYNGKGTRLLYCPPGKKGIVEIEDGVIGIARKAFSGCCKLEAINVDRNNGMYGSVDGLLYQKSGGALNSLVCCPAGKTGCAAVADGVKEIDSSAFYGCSSLTEVTIPKSVTSIGYYGEDIFEECGDVFMIRCAKGSYAEGYAKENGIPYEITKRTQTITASDFVKAVGDAPFAINASTDGDGALSYESSDDSVASVSRDGTVTVKGVGTARITIRAAGTEGYEAAEKTITVTVNPHSGGSAAIGDSFAIGGSVFQITSIEPREACFMGFNPEGQTETPSALVVSEVIVEGITYHVTSIADRAFYGLGTLQRISIGEHVKSIGEEAFSGCSSLGAVRIPEGVTEIGARAFSGCSSLVTARIPESVTEIGDGAFDGCAEGLRMICAEGSAAEAYATAHGIRHKTSEDAKAPQSITAADYIKTAGDAPFAINATTDGDGALGYESSDESVAAVSAKGTVFIMGSGTAIITITASETEDYEAAEKTITITVNPKPGGGDGSQDQNAKRAQSITAPDFMKTYGDRPFALGARADGGGALSYEVGDTGIASVDGNGTVTLEGCGVTEIRITAAAHGDYLAAEKTVTLTVKPKKLKITSAKSAKAKTLTVKWKKDMAADGYVIQCSTDRKFKKNVKTVTVKKNKTASKKVTKLKTGKKYYVRACAYAEADGGKVMGAYGKARKAVKVKK